MVSKRAISLSCSSQWSLKVKIYIYGNCVNFLMGHGACHFVYMISQGSVWLEGNKAYLRAYCSFLNWNLYHYHAITIFIGSNRRGQRKKRCSLFYVIQLLLIAMQFSKNAWSYVGCFAIEKTNLITSLLFFISLTPADGSGMTYFRFETFYSKL